MYIVFIRYITYYYLIFFFANKCQNTKRINEKWNYTLNEYYYVYGVLCSRLECKSAQILGKLPLLIKITEEMYNTMNLYTSIPKSSFYNINILILPINTREKYLKYSIHFASFATTSHYESNFPYHEIRKFHDVMQG